MNTPTFTEEMKTRLLEEKRRLEDELKRLPHHQNPKTKEAADEEAKPSESEDDSAAEAAQFGDDLSLEEELYKSLRDVLAALKSIETGTYGICKYCKKPIDERRLRARPSSSSCVECKKNPDSRDLNSMPRLVRFAPLIACAVVLLDGWFKWTALASLPSDITLAHPSWFALAVHENFGIAFNIPLALPVILIVSVILGILLLNIAWENRKINPALASAALITVIGGIGNLFDRVVYGFTVDYIILFDRSAINLSDCVILFGIVWLLMASRGQVAPTPLDKGTKNS